MTPLGRITLLLLSVISLGAVAVPASEPVPKPKPLPTQPDANAIIVEEMAPLREALTPLIQAAQADYAIPGLSLALVRHDRTLWLEGFGLAEPEQQRPAQAQTRYRAGSLAKPITALLVLAQQAQGRIDIDQPVGSALPGFRLQSRFDQTAQPITLRQLLGHHSGLPSDLNKGLWSDEPFTQVRERLRDEYAAFPPNLIFHYSNLGYSLLGHLLQVVTQTPFAEHAQQTLFEPLGLSQTRFAAQPTRDDAFAMGHRNGDRFAPLPLRDLPAQGLETNAADMARLSIALLCAGELEGKQLIEPSLIEAMIEPQNADIALDKGLSVGLGVFLEQQSILGATRVVRHSGNSLGYTAEWVLLPEQGLGVVVLANAGHAERVVTPLAEAILTNAMTLEPEPIPADLFVAAAKTPPTPTDATEPTETLPAEGHFATDLGLIAIQPQRDRLCACMTGEQLDLMPYPQGWIGAAPSDQRGDASESEPARLGSASLRRLRELRLQTRLIEGREVLVADTPQGERIIGEKVPQEPVPQAWQERLGAWRILNPDPGFPVTDLQLKLTDGKLCLSYRMPVLSPDRIQVPLRAVTNERAILLGLGRTRGDSVQMVDHEGQARLRWSGYLAEPVDQNGEPKASSAGAQFAR
ncbi:MAG: serine hydrolase domain-containing protein [Lamprobacter sp.]|uniref:serine hydrolase domain-containing protein n=1 Tax=Lamprobacter sp. TaxID=3100796 RepID=UPI002B262DD1|nr:serine hydrolase domain-containing protein [Lamprobacter sp.]MEA3641238.1 serine hydrolase domain-containing protein [Lamprobacter sp.]